MDKSALAAESFGSAEAKLFHVKHFHDSEQESLFLEFLKAHNQTLSGAVLEKLYEYADCLLAGNEKTNLISKNDAKKLLSRHFTDSLIPFCLLKDELQMSGKKRFADIGSGGGCPVIPLAIVLPEIQFYATEARTLRHKFLTKTKQTLKLENLEVIGKRFETSELENLDFVSSRAVSTFENDWKLASKSLKRGGYFLTLKSLPSILHLNGKPEIKIKEYSLPNEEQRYALAYRRYL